MIDKTGIENDINLEAAIRAYDGVSFRSDKRGASVVSGYIEALNDLANHIEQYAKDDRQKEIAQSVFDDLRAKYKAKTLAWMSAQSRCISTMITGPANFPVRRAEKANASERKRSDELLAFYKAMKGYAEKNLDRAIPKEEKKTDEIADLKSRIEVAELFQEFMKEANTLNRKKDDIGLQKLFMALFKDEQKAAQKLAEFKKPNYMNATGYERFQLTNNLANIKRMKERLSILEKKQVKAETIGEEAQQLNGLEIVRNHAEDRLQLIFQGKPEENVRSLLKSHGFKWSPRFNAWQRQLTNNAEYSLKNFVMKNEAMAQYAA